MTGQRLSGSTSTCWSLRSAFYMENLLAALR